MENDFIKDVSEIRRQARMHVEDGALTQGYSANRDTIVKLLNDALATEIVCVLRYRRHYFMAKGIAAEPVAEEFLEHANEELSHADKLAARIAQLGGEPNFNPDSLSARSHAEYIEGKDLNDMVRENLIAERIAIDSYREMIHYIADNDPTTRRLLEEILAKEEEHADELSNLVKPELPKAS
ncbi:MAG: hypothetical protein K2W82_09730 [Candidatus Obscuribacterales bacterium]|nr:hypothetical protein [Candidatus Obscuribacterales bacterium]